MARDDIFLLKSTYRQLFPKHTRHSKFVGLCGGGGNTGPARSRASGQGWCKDGKSQLTNFLQQIYLNVARYSEGVLATLTDSTMSE